jgi:hypothetical protein
MAFMFSSSLEINDPREMKQFLDKEENKVAEIRVTEKRGWDQTKNEKTKCRFSA